MLVVFTTAADAHEAERLAAAVVDRKLAACVQILPAITSVYAWRGKIEKASECLLLIKTTGESFAALDEFLRGIHSYETPEIVAVAAEKVSTRYREWLEEYIRS